MKGHLKAVVEVDQKEYEHVEKQLNAHMHAWCNILQARERVQSNYQATNNAIPPLYGLRKDHKNHDNIEKGPPTRPVCGAVVSSNYRISYFLSSFLRPLIKRAPEICDSAEDLLSRIKSCNESKDLQTSIIGSMDVAALYPSIDVDFSIVKCIE